MKIVSPSGRKIEFMGKTHRNYIKEGKMRIPNAYSMNVRDGITYFSLKKKRKNKLSDEQKGIDKEDILLPQLEFDKPPPFSQDKKSQKLTKNEMKALRKGDYYTQAFTKDVFTDDRIKTTTYTVEEKKYYVIEKDLIFIANLIFNVYLKFSSEVKGDNVSYTINPSFRYDENGEQRSFSVRGRKITFFNIYKKLYELLPQSESKPVWL